MSFDVSGMLGGLSVLARRVEDHTVNATARGIAVIQTQARMNASSGRPGLIMRSGDLVRSITNTPVKQTSPGTWMAQTAPHVVYGRIQELGGTIVPKAGDDWLTWIGVRSDGTVGLIRKKSVTLVPRPYLGPALKESGDLVTKICVDEWGKAFQGD